MQLTNEWMARAGSPALGHAVRPDRWQRPVTVPRAPVDLLLPVPPHGGVGEDRVRRVVNLVIAAAALVLLSPVMLVVAALVKLGSRGPVIYAQPRVGRDRRTPACDFPTGRRGENTGGRIFRIYKFRTMYVGSDRGRQVWATPGDPRITPVGRVLRKTRLDELPQLFNVLRGDMNIVGPRPEQPEIFEQLEREIPRWRERQRVRPGITGLAQIRHHYGQTLDDMRHKLRFDLEYIGRSSAAEDLRIMARTLPVMIGRRGGW